ncbi:MAG TPA: DHA2 family efflux MFS transporter permease subunit [Burkholderiales bacterium]|nr:DHA2 family efflux MFS transporter permease subunit [Burkholderiales bacterium]
MALDKRKRWIALVVLCLGELMIVLDTTIVGVALPSIREDLRFTEATLVWVVNAYMLTYGGFLLLGGRLGDLYGQRRLFVGGTLFFSAASLVCGLASSQWLLVAARFAQGLGGAVVSSIALSLIMNLFQEPAERARAMGVYGFVCAAGGSIGVLVGGLLTSGLSWHWIFLVNLPIGAAVCAFCVALVPDDRPRGGERLDVSGAVLITLALMFAIYGIVNGNDAGWTSPQTLGFIGAGAALFVMFVLVEAFARVPLMPLGLFRLRNLSSASVIGALWSAAMFAWFFLSALYMQLVLGYSPLQVGLAFLPANLIMAALSLGISARMVMRFGNRLPLAAGLALVAAGLALFALAPVEGSFLLHVLPAMTVMGIGCGMALNPILLVAMGEVEASESGLASGVVNTAFMLGGSLGLAVLASLSAARTADLLAAGAAMPGALHGGYQVAFVFGAIFAGIGALLSAVLLRGDRLSPSYKGA